MAASRKLYELAEDYENRPKMNDLIERHADTIAGLLLQANPAGIDAMITARDAKVDMTTRRGFAELGEIFPQLPAHMESATKENRKKFVDAIFAAHEKAEKQKAFEQQVKDHKEQHGGATTKPNTAPAGTPAGPYDTQSPPGLQGAVPNQGDNLVGTMPGAPAKSGWDLWQAASPEDVEALWRTQFGDVATAPGKSEMIAQLAAIPGFEPPPNITLKDPNPAQKPIDNIMGQPGPATTPAKPIPSVVITPSGTQYEGPMGEVANVAPAVAKYYDLDAGVKEKLTVGEHTRQVLAMWNNFKSDEMLADIGQRSKMNLQKLLPHVLALHDIGKGIAVSEGDKRKQHERTVPILQDVLKKMGYGSNEVALATALVNHDILGKLVRNRITPRDAATMLREQSQAAAFMPRNDFLKLATMIYKSDAGSYESVRKQIMDEGMKVDRNVWLRRGGFWTREKTNITTPYCRHSWEQVVVRKK
jgi:hypothetical protein